MKSGNFTVDEIEFKLKQYCSYQDRCHNEVEKKLKSFDVISEVKEQIIFNLINENYLNETRFCKSFVRGKFKIKNWGKKRIIFQLKQHQISDYNIKIALQEIDEVQYIETLNLLSEKIWKSSKESVLSKRKIKFISALQYRGWEANLIYDQLNKFEKNK